MMISDTSVIENSGVTPKWVPTPFCNPFWSHSIVFNQSSIASVIAALMLTLSVNGPLTSMVHGNVRMCQTVQWGERGNLRTIRKVYGAKENQSVPDHRCQFPHKILARWSYLKIEKAATNNLKISL